jgi:hypothetical protein
LKPHAGQVYSRPKRRHFSQRQILTAPQVGQLNLTVLSPGTILFPHEIHDGMVSVHYQADSHLFKG